MKNKLITALALLALFAMPANFAQAAIEAGSINTNATEQQLFDPDLMILRLSVETRGKTSKEAMDENSRIAKAVISSLKAKLNPDELKTSNVSVHPVYNYKNKINNIEYYQARNEVIIKSSKIDSAKDLIPLALSNGATSVSGLNFDLKDKDNACNAVMQKSVAKARAKAQLIAKALNVELGTIKTVSANCSGNYYAADRMVMGAYKNSQAEYEEVPIEIKQIPIQATTSIEYYIK